MVAQGKELRYATSFYRSPANRLTAVFKGRILFFALSITISIINPAQSASLRLGGVEVPDSRIIRDGAGQVISLNLSGLGLRDESFLDNIRPFTHTIQAINLSDNKFSRLDLSPLSSAINLFSIDLSNNSIRDINLSPLSGLPRLSLVVLASNRIESISLSPLSKCPKLRILQIQDNQLSNIDITPLLECHEFRTLWLYKNRLTNLCIDTLLRIESLKELRVYENKLSDSCISELERVKSQGDIDIMF